MFVTSMEEMVTADSWARIVDLFVDAMPLEDFGFKNMELNKEGNLPYHPGDLFKLVLYGYRKRIRSSLKLSEACKINVEVIWLLKGLRPSPRTINYFRSNNGDAIDKAHRHFVKLLQNWKFIKGETLAVDSMKIRGQNSLKNNFNQKKIKRHLDYIDGRIEDYLDQLGKINNKQKKTGKDRKEKKDLENKIKQKEAKKKEYKEMEQRVKASPDGQVSTTDPDARAVIHKRNIVQVGYNIHATADDKHNLIVDVFSKGVNDTYGLSEAGKRAQEVLGIEKINLLADKGYHTGIELARCERRGVRPYVSPKEANEQSVEGFNKSDFKYDKERNTYTCPAGSILRTNGSVYKKQDRGQYRFRRYLTNNCQQCPMKHLCTAREQGRMIERPLHQAYVDRNDNRVKKDMWYYKKRQEIIEHIFGTIKRQWDMDHTLVKGRKNVETEYRLAAICYNLTRVVSIIGIERLRKRLKRLQKSLFSTIFLFSGSRECLNTVNRYIYNFQSTLLRPLYLAPGGRG